jgi:hypothetical protein
MTRKFTVTLPDGTVAKRSSKSADYRFAVVVSPIDPERYARYILEANADEVEREAALVRAALCDLRIRKTNRGFRTEDNFNSYDYSIAGANRMYHNGRGSYPLISTRGNQVEQSETTKDHADDLGLTYTTEDTRYSTTWVVVDTQALLVAEARQFVKDQAEAAATHRANAAAVRAGDLSSVRQSSKEWGVVRWSRTYDLATKAAQGEFAGFGKACDVTVVPVVEAGVTPVQPVGIRRDGNEGGSF